ncbi:hypothetical protein IQ264_12475 [Phormidium sp. LEGE 05292]|uniref:hypothetical protein n=1 Tax=[Phormidium] sp. LEGE 05292 TaxID=767427 RepID=UPI00187DDDEC|nr:hypothetical protein [Phormidium sp. LEGE 05292]MBE9226240.1 hypothetical protein [Phormidium sp. LEGE 05292]
MTRFIHDQFAKDYLEKLLTPYGVVQAPRRVAGEVREIDVWFAPNSQPNSPPEDLGLLGRLATSISIFEPYRNAASDEEIGDCLLKILEVRGELRREANQVQDEEDRELIMRLAPLYQQDREQAMQQGVQEGERLVVENLLRVRFGSLDAELSSVIDRLLLLPPEEFTPLLLQLSREELLARFAQPNS